MIKKLSIKNLSRKNEFSLQNGKLGLYKKNNHFEIKHPGFINIHEKRMSSTTHYRQMQLRYGHKNIGYDPEKIK